MIFPFATSFIAVLALGQTALAGLTPAQVVTNINLVTTISGNTNSALSLLSIQSSPDVVKSTGTTLANNFNTIIQSVSADITAMDATSPFTVDADAFVKVHQALLATVIGQHGIFAQFVVTAPIAAVLRQLEKIVDSFAFSLIALIPTRMADVNTQATMLGNSLTTTISVYQQICVPSLFYPKNMPICVDAGGVLGL